MKYLLDTNTCIYIIKKKPVSVIEHLTKIDASDIGISAITLSELEYGVEKSSKPEQNRIALLEFSSLFEVVSYDEKAAGEYGRIRASLEKSGSLIGSLDMFIAAHAKSLQVTLITNNVREFYRVEGLLIQNWVE